jgi:2,3,4,5-tetrahydropyridine-2,6-dicarboxylate N-succinyltransferase
MTAASSSHHQFHDNVQRCTQPAATVALLKVYLDGELIRTVANVPGQAGALRVLSHYQVNQELTPAAVANALEVFAPFVDEARANPGVHPTIDLLLGLGPSQTLRFECVESPPDLFTKLLEGSASQSEKQAAVDLLDGGLVRCAEKLHGYTVTSDGVRLTKSAVWVTQPYAVACMNAGFSAFPMVKMGEHFFDKVPLKTEGWQQADFERAGVRFVPGSFARRGAFIGAGTTIMPGGIVNIGAYIAGQGVMIDGGARVATGAQVCKGVKLGAGSGIEGILEPQGRLPSIVEDNVRVGANCELCGIVEEGAVVASGVVMASGKKIYDLRTNAEVEPRYMEIGEKFFEVPYIPRNRVAVSGVYTKTDRLGIDCIVLLEKDAADTSLAQLPRNAALYVKL